jgi:hypothetical protein
MPQFHLIGGGPRRAGPFNPATGADGWVFVTGRMPTGPAARSTIGVTAPAIRALAKVACLARRPGAA